MLNKTKYVKVTCIAVFMNAVSCVAETIFRYSDEKLTWFEAQKKCQDINGNLIEPYLSKIKGLQKSCAGDVIEEIWSGHYHAQSDWIEFVGCYTELNRPKLQRKSLTTSDPLECQHLCQNSTYFGFYKGDICICFGSDNYVLGNKLEADAQNCNIRCADRESVFCGGHKAVSVYRTVTKTFTDKPGYDCTAEDCNCISAECKESGEILQKEFYKQPCSTDMATVCSNNVLTTGESPQWTESLTRCASQENRYPISSSASEEFCEKSTSTWTSIFRDVFVAKDELGINLANVKYCRYIDMKGNPATTKQDSCSLKMKFVCEIDAREQQKNYNECRRITASLEQSGDQLAPGGIAGISITIVGFIICLVSFFIIRRFRNKKGVINDEHEKENRIQDIYTKNNISNEQLTDESNKCHGQSENGMKATDNFVFIKEVTGHDITETTCHGEETHL